MNSLPTNSGRIDETFEVARRIRQEIQEHKGLDPRSHRHLSRIAHVVDIGVLLLDDRLNILFASARAHELFSVDEASFEEVWQRICADTLTGSQDTGSAVERLELTVEAEATGRPVRLSIQRFDDDEDAGFLVLARDALAAKALERDLQLAAQLRGLMGLFMGLTHDLKAPLHAMVLNLELLKQAWCAAVPRDHEIADKGYRRLETLEEELQRLERSLERLLAQTAPPNSELLDYDLGPVVTEIGEFLDAQARQQNVEFNIHLPRSPLPTRGSPDLFKQALVNLAVNAFEALPDGGKMQLDVALDGDWIVLQIRDSGHGIAPSDRRHLFELHFTTKASGTGLGLYVTRALAESQNGQLRLLETGPQGTTFELRLPRVGQKPDR